MCWTFSGAIPNTNKSPSVSLAVCATRVEAGTIRRPSDAAERGAGTTGVRRQAPSERRLLIDLHRRAVLEADGHAIARRMHSNGVRALASARRNRCRFSGISGRVAPQFSIIGDGVENAARAEGRAV